MAEYRLCLERLRPRTAPTTNVMPDGFCSLRSAIPSPGTRIRASMPTANPHASSIAFMHACSKSYRAIPMRDLDLPPLYAS